MLVCYRGGGSQIILMGVTCLAITRAGFLRRTLLVVCLAVVNLALRRGGRVNLRGHAAMMRHYTAVGMTGP